MFKLKSYQKGNHQKLIIGQKCWILSLKIHNILLNFGSYIILYTVWSQFEVTLNILTGRTCIEKNFRGNLGGTEILILWNFQIFNIYSVRMHSTKCIFSNGNFYLEHISYDLDWQNLVKSIWQIMHGSKFKCLTYLWNLLILGSCM